MRDALSQDPMQRFDQAWESDLASYRKRLQNEGGESDEQTYGRHRLYTSPQLYQAWQELQEISVPE